MISVYRFCSKSINVENVWEYSNMAKTLDLSYYDKIERMTNHEYHKRNDISRLTSKDLIWHCNNSCVNNIRLQ